MEKNYQNLVFTNHAIDRIKLRKITQDQIRQVLSDPEKTFPSNKPEQIKFIRTLNQRSIHVIGKYLTDQKKWLIISVWVRGEDDPVPLVWQIITLPFRMIAKIAIIIISYINKYLLEKKKI